MLISRIAHGSGQMPPLSVNDLVHPEQRSHAAEELAAEVGAESFIILIPDPEMGVLRPAPGFPQTLPGGATWRAFLARCKHPGEIEAEIAFPTTERITTIRAFVSDLGAVVVFIGGAPRVPPASLISGYPFLIPLLIAESEAFAATGVARAAQEAERHAATLTEALDRLRKDLAERGEELRGALTEAARLNAELSTVNATLEQRVSQEIQERMKAEETLRQAQKMDAIGQLTGGVAHDFNNLLTVIMGGLDSIKRFIGGLPDGPESARAKRACDYGLQASKQAAVLTSRLLAFARRQPLAPKPTNVDRLVANISELLMRTLGEQISLETVASARLWWAEVDAAELERAIVNLAVNARDAMPDGGKLTIETGNVFLDEDYVTSLVEPVKSGQYVMLAVTDTGLGMDKQTVDRAFEPFFTTKEVGKGTGLGLSQVYGFVRQSNGHIRIYSEPGQGTSVKIYLPRVIYSESTAAPTEKGDHKERCGGNETILLVEDHDALRAFAVATLRDLGYRVIEAANGSTALELLEKHPDIQLLFTDVVLPDGMDGRRLAGEATRRRARA